MIFGRQSDNQALPNMTQIQAQRTIWFFSNKTATQLCMRGIANSNPTDPYASYKAIETLPHFDPCRCLGRGCWSFFETTFYMGKTNKVEQGRTRLLRWLWRKEKQFSIILQSSNVRVIIMKINRLTEQNVPDADEIRYVQSIDVLAFLSVVF